MIDRRFQDVSYGNRTLTGNVPGKSIPCAVFGFLILALYLTGCSSTISSHRGYIPDEPDLQPSQFSLVIIIHGDGNYLYHDVNGNAYRADEGALARAKSIAKHNEHAEVFIFHQKPKRRFLGLFFRRSDARFYHYRNGHLLADEPYRRAHGKSRFTPEADLYNRFRAEEQTKPVRFFLYFGHEIPEFTGKGYDASYSNESFTIRDLASGLKKMTDDSGAFDLIVLSTCFNGTPYTISTLTPYAQYIIASPDNLHLSYFDLSPFEQLETAIPDGDVYSFAMKYAHHTFTQLKENIQTTVSVALYDVERVQNYLQSVDSIYKPTLDTLEDNSFASFEYVDCAEDSAYAHQKMSKGVEVFYRPSRFGRSQYIQSHSGWTCRSFIE